MSGKTINAYLTNKEMKYPDEAIHLIFAANRWEMRDQILADLKSGITLICDRYAFSGVAYSAAKVRSNCLSEFRAWTTNGARTQTADW